MLVLFTASCLALLLTYLGSKDKMPLGLEFAFCIVTFVAAIHYNYGNDYKTYAYMFDSFTQYDFDINLIIDKKLYKEPGWTFICFLFQPLGFFSLIAFISFVQNYIYYLFIKNYAPKNWWVLAVFIYLFSDSLWVLNMSLIRQGLCVALFILAWMIASRRGKNIAYALVIVFIASTIHSSAMILYPFFLILFLKREHTLYFAIALFVFAFLMFINPDFTSQLVLYLGDAEDLSRMLKRYESVGASDSFGLGFCMKITSFFVLIYYLIKNDSLSIKAIRCIALASFSFALIPLIMVNTMAGRFLYYFVAFQIPAIPMAYKELPLQYRVPFLGIFVFFYAYCYVSFFYCPIWTDSYLHFHSIFEVIF